MPSCFVSASPIDLDHLQITHINQTFTQTFPSPFQKFPSFAYCKYSNNKVIESGTVQNSEFSVSCDETLTSLTSSQIIINFYTNKSNAFASNEVVNIALLVTDEASGQFQIGIKKVTLSLTFSISFPGLILVNNGSAYGLL